MLNQRLKDKQEAKQFKKWIILATMRHWIVRLFEIFDHERFMIAHRRRMLPIFLRIRTKFRKRVLVYGRPYELRLRK